MIANGTCIHSNLHTSRPHHGGPCSINRTDQSAPINASSSHRRQHAIAHTSTQNSFQTTDNTKYRRHAYSRLYRASHWLMTTRKCTARLAGFNLILHIYFYCSWCYCVVGYEHTSTCRWSTCYDLTMQTYISHWENNIIVITLFLNYQIPA